MSAQVEKAHWVMSRRGKNTPTYGHVIVKLRGIKHKDEILRFP